MTSRPMTPRRLPLGALALVLALAGLGWGLFALHRVFAAERAEAINTVDARRRVLDRFAAQAFADRLARRLAQARPAINAAESDPLAPAAGLYRRRAEVTVPAPVRYAKHSDAGALYETLRDPQQRPPPPPGPWGESLQLREALIDAVAGGGDATIERAFRALLDHRARHRLEPARDLPATLAVLAWFADAMPADPALLRAVLHDGYGRDAAHVEGLQRALLRHRDVFDADAFHRLADEIERLSRLGEVPRAAFIQARTPPMPPSVPDAMPAAMLIDEGRWYVAPRRDGTGHALRDDKAAPDGTAVIDGIRIDVIAEVAAVEEVMRGGALLEADEGISFDPNAPVPVAVRSPQWHEAPARARATWRLKLALIWLCALLALAAMTLGLLDARRRRRFVELKSDFIAAVSHELRTPLAAIRLMAETLERRVADVPRARDYPARIVRSADALGFLVENLLSFNRIDKGRWVARTQPLRPSDVLHRVRESVEAAFEVPVEWHITGLDAMTLDTDPTLVELLLANLVRNAIQHHGGDAITLTVEGITAADGSHAIRVTDDGPGIAPKAVPHVFEPFYRGDPRPGSTGSDRHRRGSGLGLALCRRIMTVHRGTLRLVRTGPDGTTFEARFPPGEEPR